MYVPECFILNLSFEYEKDQSYFLYYACPVVAWAFEHFGNCIIGFSRLISPESLCFDVKISMGSPYVKKVDRFSKYL